MHRKQFLYIAASLFLLSKDVFPAEKQLASGAEIKPPVTASDVPTARFPRPFPMGVSISNIHSAPYIYAGTAGLKVQAVSNPSYKFILSNNHVLGTVGPNLCPGSAPAGTFAIQPGSLDIGTDPGANPYYLAGLFGARVPLQTGFTAQNYADAAISFTNDALASSTILNIGEPNPGIQAPTVGLAVTKSGRTTGVTNGIISAVNVTVNVNYGPGCPIYHFVRQVEIASGTFSNSGDSGSAILDSKTKTPVALLFAGSSNSTLANDIRYVYALLGIQPAGASGSLNVNPSLAAKDPQQALVEEVQARHEGSLFSIPSVVGVGLSRDAAGWFIKVFAKELTPALIAAAPASVEGVRVKVIGTGEFRAY
jgi:hypothetical protein